MYRRLTALLFFSLSMFAGHAQQSPPKGRFLVDSMKIGEPIPYSLSFSFPAENDAVFPDSLSDFSPFEIDHKEYYPTRTVNGISYDSAVYYLSCFEIDSLQVYAMPLIYAVNGDSTRLSPVADTVFLKQLVAEIPDSVAVEAMPLKENTDPVRMNLALNYPYIFIGVAIAVLIILIVIFAFGKKLLMYYRLHRMSRTYGKFIRTYDEMASQTAISVQDKSEKLISLWKKYLQQLEAYPYTTLTTREVIERIPKEKLTNALSELDASMYSPRHPKVNSKSVEILKEFATERFQRAVIKAKNRE